MMFVQAIMSPQTPIILSLKRLARLQNMLLTFRVSELQMLLGYAGQNKTGRKTELQARALELLTKSTSAQARQIHSKIRELYKSIQSVCTFLF